SDIRTCGPLGSVVRESRAGRIGKTGSTRVPRGNEYRSVIVSILVSSKPAMGQRSVTSHQLQRSAVSVQPRYSFHGARGFCIYRVAAPLSPPYATDHSQVIPFFPPPVYWRNAIPDAGRGSVEQKAHDSRSRRGRRPDPLSLGLRPAFVLVIVGFPHQ